jgi:hypothetical protein
LRQPHDTELEIEELAQFNRFAARLRSSARRACDYDWWRERQKIAEWLETSMNKKPQMPRLNEAKINQTHQAEKQQFEQSEMVERFLAVISLAAKVASRTQSKPAPVAEASRDRQR